MSIKQPHITVLMPAYNAERYICEAISSVLRQTFTGFELLIINDGSTDRTPEIIKSFKDPRITLYNQSNSGVAAALNTGLKLARAPYVARFDADDVCYPERLQVQYDFMQANPGYSIIGSAADYIDADGTYLFTHQPAGYTNEELQRLNYNICSFIHSTVFYKKEVILQKGGYNELAHTFEDHFLWASILEHEKVCNLPQPLIKVRLNPESVTIDEKWHTPRFTSIKNAALKKRSITPAEGDKLQRISHRQVSPKIKEGAYYALCGKKFLVNNYQPQKARLNIIKAISLHPFRLDNYLLYTVSYFPESFIIWLHKGGFSTVKSFKQLSR